MLGDRLDLFKTLAAHGTAISSELAERAEAAPAVPPHYDMRAAAA